MASKKQTMAVLVMMILALESMIEKRGIESHFMTKESCWGLTSVRVSLNGGLEWLFIV